MSLQPDGRADGPDDDGLVVHIARCPDHGLHGARPECFICGGPVEQVAMVPAGSLDAALERAVDALMADSGLPRYGGHRATVERRQRIALAAAFGADWRDALDEHARFRKALVRIADAQSGLWGKVAHEALNPPAAA